MIRQFLSIKAAHAIYAGYITIILCLLAGTDLKAQSRLKFRSNELLGFTNGEMGSYGQFQTINGLSYRSWFAGVGVGLDYYRFRSVPLFLSLNKDLVRIGRSTLLIGLDGGTNIPWFDRIAPGSWPPVKSKFHPGPYWNTRIGYRFNISTRNSQAILLSAGYSYKKLSENQPPCKEASGFCPVAYPNNDKYIYSNNRLSLMIGWQF